MARALRLQWTWCAILVVVRRYHGRTSRDASTCLSNLVTLKLQIHSMCPTDITGIKRAKIALAKYVHLFDISWLRTNETSRRKERTGHPPQPMIRNRGDRFMSALSGSADSMGRSTVLLLEDSLENVDSTTASLHLLEDGVNLEL
jgi:hypothetical protein